MSVAVIPERVRRSEGEEVPIPTLTPDPSTRALLIETRAFAPMAVALVRLPVQTSADNPSAVL